MLQSAIRETRSKRQLDVYGISMTRTEDLHRVGREGRHEANGDETGLAHQEVGLRVAREARAVGQRHRGGIDHDQAEQHQRHHHPDERVVEADDARRASRVHPVADRHAGAGLVRAAAAQALQPAWYGQAGPFGQPGPEGLEEGLGVHDSDPPRSSASACIASAKTCARCA